MFLFVRKLLKKYIRLFEYFLIFYIQKLRIKIEKIFSNKKIWIFIKQIVIEYNNFFLSLVLLFDFKSLEYKGQKN